MCTPLKKLKKNLIINSLCVKYQHLYISILCITKKHLFGLPLYSVTRHLLSKWSVIVC